MVFSSMVFLFCFLPIVLFAFYALPRPLRNLFLLIANLVFYGWGEPVYVLLMVFATVVNFILGWIIDRWREARPGVARACVCAAVLISVASLGAFKYAGLLAELPELTWNGVLSGDFESGFERWMSDHIPGREALVGLNACYLLASGRNGLDGNHALVTIETDNEADNEAGENLLMIRDSFGHCFAPFAADSFRRIALVDLRYYRGFVTELAKEMEIDRAIVLYGADNFAGDSNFGWLR